jgi:hypothetical protein
LPDYSGNPFFVAKYPAHHSKYPATARHEKKQEKVTEKFGHYSY